MAADEAAPPGADRPGWTAPASSPTRWDAPSAAPGSDAPRWDSPGGDSPGGGGPGWSPPGWGSWQAPPPGPPPAPRPGIVPLRPLDLGEILDGSLQAVRTNPRAMLGLPAIVAGAYLLLSTLVESIPGGLLRLGSPAGLDTDATGPTSARRLDELLSASLPALVLLVVLALLYGIARTAVQSCLTWLVAEAALGRRHSIGGGWRAVRRLVPRLIGLAVVEGLIVLGVSVVVGALAAGAVAAAAALLHGTARVLVIVVVALVLVLGWAVAVALVAVRLLVAAPVLVLGGRFPAPDGTGPPTVRRAVATSWRLVRGSTWRVFGILLVVSLIAQVVAGIVAVPVIGIGVALSVAGSVAGHPAAASLGSSTAGALGSLVGTMLGLPFVSAAVTLVYLDLRMRREGLDLAIGLR